MARTTFILFLFSFIQLFGQNGNIKTYYPSGKVASRLAFVKDILEGTSYWYFENGNIKESREYSNGRLNGSSKTFYENGLIKSDKNYYDGMLHGVYKTYYENGGLKSTMTYNYGELTNSNQISYDSLYIAPLTAYEAGKNKKNIDSHDFICALEICPEPIGGIEEIEKNIIYPKLAKQFNLEGYVLLTATITTRGKAINVRVNKGLGLGCDEAAIEAVKNTNFIPGRNNGDEIETDVTFKLNFNIKESSDNTSAMISEPTDSEDIESQIKDENEVEAFITCEADICPEPKGGIIELLKKLRYPPHAKRNNISGNVIIKANIDEVGFVISAEVIKGIGYGCDEAAKSAVIKTEFEPGKLNGMDTESTITITVPFILDDAN